MIQLAFIAATNSQREFFTKIMSGLRKLHVNGRVIGKISNTMPIMSSRSKTVACWGWRRGKMYHQRGFDVLVFERGYLGDRFSWTSVAWNGLNGRGDFKLTEPVTMDRFNEHFKLKPYKHDGHNIIIMGQVRGDASLRGMDLTDFYETTAKKLKQHYDKPVFFRPHPISAKKGNGFKPHGIATHQGNLKEALEDAFLVVSYNSNAGVDAAVNGIPSLAFDKGSMAYNISGHTVDERIFPDRDNWAAKLAWCQWSPEEIINGAFWPRMQIEGKSIAEEKEPNLSEVRTNSFIKMLEERA